MTTSTARLPELFWPGIMDIWGATYNEWESVAQKVFDSKKSDKKFEKEQGITGLALAAIKEEGGDIFYDEIAQGLQKEYVMVTYALGSSVTREAMEDEQYGQINNIPMFLARSMRQTEETVAANIFNNAFTSTTGNPDGVYLCATNHPLVHGGTFSNTLQTAADLTQASLEQAMIDISDIVDDRNLPINLRATLLVVPTALQYQAQKILKTSQEVGSADNTINPMQGVVTSKVWPFLTDSDAWFLKTDVPNGLTFFNRRPAEIRRENEFDTENLKFKTSRRFDVGCTNPRGVYGSSGT